MDIMSFLNQTRKDREKGVELVICTRSDNIFPEGKYVQWFFLSSTLRPAFRI